nr:MAG TPA: hypothetical protein [Bacteriophage sp.]
MGLYSRGAVLVSVSLWRQGFLSFSISFRRLRYARVRNCPKFAICTVVCR